MSSPDMGRRSGAVEAERFGDDRSDIRVMAG
jgi:hypothetical protein